MLWSWACGGHVWGSFPHGVTLFMTKKREEKQLVTAAWSLFVLQQPLQTRTTLLVWGAELCEETWCSTRGVFDKTMCSFKDRLTGATTGLACPHPKLPGVTWTGRAGSKVTGWSNGTDRVTSQMVCLLPGDLLKNKACSEELGCARGLLVGSKPHALLQTISSWWCICFVDLWGHLELRHRNYFLERTVCF